ncbi:MAG: hypothetical protein ACYC35_14825 [Pirellulales bacterium]
MKTLPTIICVLACLGLMPFCADRHAAAQPFDLKAARERDARIFRELEWKITGKRPPAKPKSDKPKSDKPNSDKPNSDKPVPEKAVQPQKPPTTSLDEKAKGSADAERREQAKRVADVEAFQKQQVAIARDSRPVLSILDRAVASGSVSEDAVAEARKLILSGRRDTRSLKLVEATAWYCLAMLAPSEQERDLRLGRARVAQAAVAEMDAASQKTIRR